MEDARLGIHLPVRYFAVVVAGQARTPLLLLTLSTDCDRALLYGVWAWLQFFTGACLVAQAC